MKTTLSELIEVKCKEFEKFSRHNLKGAYRLTDSQKEKIKFFLRQALTECSQATVDAVRITEELKLVLE